jgi:hypothetical protein
MPLRSEVRQRTDLSSKNRVDVSPIILSPSTTLRTSGGLSEAKPVVEGSKSQVRDHDPQEKIQLKNEIPRREAPRNDKMWVEVVLQPKGTFSSINSVFTKGLNGCLTFSFSCKAMN